MEPLGWHSSTSIRGYFLHLFPGQHFPLSLIKFIVFALQIFLFQHLFLISQHLIHMWLGDYLLLNELVSILEEDRLHLVDGLIHEWLGEHRLIQFIMSMFAIANNVNNHIPLEGLPKLHSQLNTFVYLFRVISIHMEYRSSNSLCHFCAV